MPNDEIMEGFRDELLARNFYFYPFGYIEVSEEDRADIYSLYNRISDITDQLTDVIKATSDIRKIERLMAKRTKLFEQISKLYYRIKKKRFDAIATSPEAVVNDVKENIFPFFEELLEVTAPDPEDRPNIPNIGVWVPDPEELDDNEPNMFLLSESYAGKEMISEFYLHISYLQDYPKHLEKLADIMLSALHRSNAIHHTDDTTTVEQFRPFIVRPAQPSEQPLKVSINRAEKIDYPLDKVNNIIWRMLEHDTQGQVSLALAMESAADKRKKKQINLLYAIDFDALKDGIAITKRLLPFDKRAYLATSALFNAGNSVISLTQIYYAMGYIGTPGSKDLENINESISKMTGARICIDNTKEADSYGYPKFIYDGSLLPIERVTSIVNGQLINAAIHVFREPPLVTFAKQRGQITTIDIKLLRSPLSKTNSNLLLEDYLLERISRAKNGKGQRRVLYRTIYEHIGLAEESPSNQKNIKKRLPHKIEKYLRYYQDCNYISRFTMETDGITVYFR